MNPIFFVAAVAAVVIIFQLLTKVVSEKYKPRIRILETILVATSGLFAIWLGGDLLGTGLVLWTFAVFKFGLGFPVEKRNTWFRHR